MILFISLIFVNFGKRLITFFGLEFGEKFPFFILLLSGIGKKSWIEGYYFYETCDLAVIRHTICQISSIALSQ